MYANKGRSHPNAMDFVCMLTIKTTLTVSINIDKILSGSNVMSLTIEAACRQLATAAIQMLNNTR